VLGKFRNVGQVSDKKKYTECWLDPQVATLTPDIGIY